MTEKPSGSPERQTAIYTRGAVGESPRVTTASSRLERLARYRMSSQAYAYVAGGAGLEETVRSNRKAFEHHRIVPRMLRDVSRRDLSVELFGRRLPSPLLLAPLGALDLISREADLQVARAAAKHGVPMIFSNQAAVPMETCAAAMGTAPRWFQLYWSKSNQLVSSFLQRAEASGCEAIVVTLDTTLLGWRCRDLDLGSLPFLQGCGLGQYFSDPVFQTLIDDPGFELPAASPRLTPAAVATLAGLCRRYPGSFLANLRSGRALKAVRLFTSIYSRTDLTWENLSFLRERTRLPILLKGILSADDAKLALDHGVDGIIVSNHGGRQVDGAIASLDALPGVVKTVAGKIPVLLDSGIRSGADIVKALALGARAVCLGRPFAYGLAMAGQEGVEEVIANLLTDFELNLALAGCRQVSDLSPDNLARSPA